MSGLRSRRKGASFERKIANTLKALWGNARRLGHAQSGNGRVEEGCPDVEGTPFFVECKHGKKPNIPGAYKQAVEATDGRPPLVITRRDGEDILVTMKLEDWLEWIKTSNSG